MAEKNLVIRSECCKLFSQMHGKFECIALEFSTGGGSIDAVNS